MVQKDKQEAIHQNTFSLFCTSYICEESYHVNSVLVEDTGLISTSFVEKEQKKRENIFKSLFEESSCEKYRDKLQFRFEKILIKRYICSFKHSCSFVWVGNKERTGLVQLVYSFHSGFAKKLLKLGQHQVGPCLSWSTGWRIKLMFQSNTWWNTWILDQNKATKTKQPNPRCTKVASVKNSATLYTEDEMAENSLMDW